MIYGLVGIPGMIQLSTYALKVQLYVALDWRSYSIRGRHFFYFHIAAFTYKLQVFLKVLNSRYRSLVQVHESCLTSNIGDSHMTVSSTR